MKVEGLIEWLQPDKVFGWAWNPEQPGEPVDIEVCQDQSIVARAVANRYRKDLDDAGKGRGYCGFSIEFSRPLSAGAVPEVRANGRKLQSARSELLRWDTLAIAQALEPIEGSVDYLRPEEIVGWVWSPSHPEVRLTVQAVLDGLVYAEATADRFREDVLAAGKGDGAHAFSLKFVPPISEEKVPEIRVKGELVRRISGPKSWSDPGDLKPFLQPSALRLGGLPKVAFHFEQFDARYVSGWAWYPSEPDLSVSLEVMCRQEVIARGMAEVFRRDLVEAGIGTGKYGFVFELPSKLARELLRLRIGGVVELQLPIPLPAPARDINSVGLPPIEGYVDALTRKSAMGWVWCPSHPELPLVVEARVDGRVIGRTNADQMRSDLLQHGKGTARYGFSLEFCEVALANETPEFHALPLRGGLLHCGVGMPPLTEREQVFATQPSIAAFIADHQRFTQPGTDYEDADPTILARVDFSKAPAKPLIFAYYLPQFHATEVNDQFWGKGFTEWRQITRAAPRFPGHYQPRVPRDLGFYDLTDPTVLFRQAELAKAAGISAFCYYYYWFNGRRVLERPLNAHMASDVEMPFMIMWANENWTKTWDGCESDVLLRQDYRNEDEDALLADWARHFADRRYVLLNGRPLFFLYNPRHIPDAPRVVARWREKLHRVHGVDPLIFMAQTFDTNDPRPYGLDGAIEFPPHKFSAQHPGCEVAAFAKEFQGRVIAYDDFVDASLSEPRPDFPLIKTIVPSWDNDARKPGRGLTLTGIGPAKYEAWLRILIQNAIDNPIEGVPLVAINAWNEWAEAAYLEPDIHYGSAFLNATARGLVSAVNDYVPLSKRKPLPSVTVVMPCYNHSRFLPERIGSILHQSAPPSEIIFLDDASTDDSVAVANKLLEHCPIPYRIEVNQTNSGNVFRQWLNGIRLAKHELVWIAETDDSADTGFLESILPAFREGSVRGAYGKICCMDPNGRRRDDLAPYYDRLKFHSWERSLTIAAARTFAYDFSVLNVIPNASGFVFRKPALTTMEEERLLKYRFAGDWYLYALLLRGGELAYVRQARSWFRVNPEGASRSAFRTDLHLEEHRMILEDLSREYGLDDRAFAEHVRRLAVFFPDQTEADLSCALMPAPTERPLRICVAAHSFSVGGGEIVPLELANELRRLGHHVTYLVMERSANDNSTIRGRLRADIPVVYWADVSGDLAVFLHNFRFDVLNSHNVSVDYHLYRLGVAVPCSWIVSLHGGYETVPDLLEPEFVTYLERGVDAWFYLAEKNRQTLLEAGLKEPDFRDSFNAVSDAVVDWVNRETFRADQNLSAGSFAMVICSRAIEGKGWRTAIDVCRRLNACQPRRVHLFMIGDGPLLDDLRREFDQDPTLHFMGYVETPIRYFRCFDVAIFPSTYVGESFPLFLVECLAAGLPVITSDIGDIPRILGNADFRAGEVVSFRQSPERMAKEMSNLLEPYLSEPGKLDVAKLQASIGAERFSMKSLLQLYLRVFKEKIVAKSVKVAFKTDAFCGRSSTSAPLEKVDRSSPVSCTSGHLWSRSRQWPRGSVAYSSDPTTDG